MCLVEDIHIGNNASIGACAVVVKDVSENATVAGIPARVISENNPGRFMNRRWTLPFQTSMMEMTTSEVVAYTKLPRTFQIPNLVGYYAPDQAIAMKKNDVKHILFVAETKGSMSSMDLSAIERAKIDCAEKLFNSISTANVKYHKFATYQDLIDEMNAIGL